MSILGRNAKLYADASADETLANLTEIPDVSDVDLSMDSTVDDTTTRADAGWDTEAQASRMLSVTGTVVFTVGDAAVNLLRTSYLAGSTITVAALTGAFGVAGSEGPRFNGVVTKWMRNEPGKGAVKISFEIKIKGFLAYEVEAGS